MEGEAQTLKSFVDDLITEWEETSASNDVETRNLLSQIIVPILNIGFVKLCSVHARVCNETVFINSYVS